MIDLALLAPEWSIKQQTFGLPFPTTGVALVEPNARRFGVGFSALLTGGVDDFWGVTMQDVPITLNFLLIPIANHKWLWMDYPKHGPLVQQRWTGVAPGVSGGVITVIELIQTARGH